MPKLKARSLNIAQNYIFHKNNKIGACSQNRAKHNYNQILYYKGKLLNAH